LLLDEIIICPTGPKRFFPRGLLARPKAHSDIGIRGTFPWHRRTRMAIGHDLTFARQSLQKLPFEMHSGPRGKAIEISRQMQLANSDRRFLSGGCCSTVANRRRRVESFPGWCSSRESFQNDPL